MLWPKMAKQIAHYGDMSPMQSATGNVIVTNPDLNIPQGQRTTGVSMDILVRAIDTCFS